MCSTRTDVVCNVNDLKGLIQKKFHTKALLAPDVAPLRIRTCTPDRKSPWELRGSPLSWRPRWSRSRTRWSSKHRTLKLKLTSSEIVLENCFWLVGSHSGLLDGDRDSNRRFVFCFCWKMSFSGWSDTGIKCFLKWKKKWKNKDFLVF